MSRHPFSILLLALCALLPAAAERAGAQGQVSISFVVMGWGTDSYDLGYRNDKKEVPLRVEDFRRSEVYQYNGPALMGLYRYASSDAPSAKKSKNTRTVEGGLPGEVEYLTEEYTPPSGPLSVEPVGTVTLPGNCKRVLLLISRSGEKAQVFALPDDTSASLAGKVRFVNLTSTKIGVQSGKDTRTAIAPQRELVLSPNSTDETLIARLAYEKDGEWPMLKDAAFPAPPAVMTTVFFLRSDDGSFRSMDGQILGPIQMFTMRVPVNPPKPAAP